jgi:hypothetical protein
MSSGLPVYPFDQDRCIGTVTEVGPTTAKVNLPKAAQPEGQWLHGHKFGCGQVGEFVFLECADLALFGRIVYVKLPERERLEVESDVEDPSDVHPVGTVQLLTSIRLQNGEVLGGIPEFPRVGSKAYLVHPQLLKWIAEASQKQPGNPDPITLELASIPSASDTAVCITPNRLFGRHCAVLGATGGGKSWTLARMIERAGQFQSKLVLLDATGEFYTLEGDIQHIQIGAGTPMPATCEEAVIPHHELTELDLFALFRPSGQVQVPKLRAALKSLKLAKILGAGHAIVKNGCIVKTGLLKEDFDTPYKQHSKVLDGQVADLDIARLCDQIQNECVYPTANYGKDPTKWGDIAPGDVSYCVPLLARIEDTLQSPGLACIFAPGTKRKFSTIFEEFINSNKKILRISLKYLPSSHDAREVIANVIGRYLLNLSKAGKFVKKPVVVFLDEAHQFLSRTLGDDFLRYPLDAFDSMAKEGRKFSATLCIATQRPRDIPEGVLSQMGTLIVHRLTNDADRQVVERASGDIDCSAAAFLPTLAPGEAIIVGVDFAIPLIVQISRPRCAPDSSGPDYQEHWKAPKPVAAAKAATSVK